MGEEVKEMVYTATNLIFIAAVLLVAMMFLGLRSNYANTVAERNATEKRIEMQNKYKDYEFKQVSGYGVMSAITAYSSEVPMYVTGAYNYIDTSAITNRLYSTNERITNPEWFKMSLMDDPIQDPLGLQSIYRKETAYYAMLTYDSDTPKQLAKDMGLDTATGTANLTGRNAGTYNTTTDNKIIWLSSKYNVARPGEQGGYTVSGVLFICIDVQGASLAKYQEVSIY